MNPRRPRHRGSGWKWAALAVVLLAGFFLARGSFRRLHKTFPSNAFYQVKRADMLISITEEGALRALNETVIRSGLDGYNRIIQLAPEGSYVQKGDLLVELDSSGVKEKLNEQELLQQQSLFFVQQAQGNVAIQKLMAESQIKDAEVAVEDALSDLEKYRDGDAPLLIKTIEARSAVLAEQVRIAGERSVRTEQLFKSGNATRSDLEADALSLKREQLGIAQYQEDLRLIKKYDRPNQIRLLQSKVEQARAELVRIKQRTSNEIAQAEADLKTSQGALDFVEEGLEQQQRRLANTKIFAPQNGLVVYASVSPFQSGGGDDERRRMEGRSRSGGGRSGGGEFRGGGGRGSRGSSDGGSGNSSGNSSRGGSSTSAADAIATGNQRIANAQSGSVAAEGAGAAVAGGGGRSGGDASGGGSGGQGVSSAASAFVSYPTLRPSSRFGAATATNSSPASTAGAADSTTAAASSSTPTTANQFGSRSSSSRNSDWSDLPFTPGMLEEGIMVRQRQELIRLPDVSKMLAEVKIEEARISQVRAGMTAYLAVQNLPGRRFQGTVRHVGLLPDAQSSWLNPDKKLFATDVLVDEQLPILKPGVTANIEIVITNLTKVLSVPIQTVARQNGQRVCLVKRGARVTPVPVTTGWFNDIFIEITSGLKEGDLVLLAPDTDEEDEEGASNKVNAAASQPRREQN